MVVAEVVYRHFGHYSRLKSMIIYMNKCFSTYIFKVVVYAYLINIYRIYSNRHSSHVNVAIKLTLAPLRINAALVG